MLDYRSRTYASYRTGQKRTIVTDDKSSRAPYLRQLIKKHFPFDRQAKIVDFGCGSGTLLYFLREAGYLNLYGVDTSPEQIMAARSQGIDYIEEGDLFEAMRNSASNSIDVVITFDVIEHMTKSELLSFGDEVFRVLKNHGRWIIHVPNADSPFGASIRYSDWTHEQAFTPASLFQILTIFGFTSVQCYEDQPIPHGTKSSIRWLLWQLIRKSLQIYRAAETGALDSLAIFSRNVLAVAVVDKE